MKKFFKKIGKGMKAISGKAAAFVAVAAASFVGSPLARLILCPPVPMARLRSMRMLSLIRFALRSRPRLPAA